MSRIHTPTIERSLSKLVLTQHLENRNQVVGSVPDILVVLRAHLDATGSELFNSDFSGLRTDTFLSLVPEEDTVQLAKTWDKGNPEQYTAAASLFLHYLKLLPEPLLTLEYYQSFNELFTISEDRRNKYLMKKLNALPLSHMSLVLWLVDFLATLMDLAPSDSYGIALAQIYAPIFQRPRGKLEEESRAERRKSTQVMALLLLNASRIRKQLTIKKGQLADYFRLYFIGHWHRYWCVLDDASFSLLLFESKTHNAPKLSLLIDGDAQVEADPTTVARGERLNNADKAFAITVNSVRYVFLSSSNTSVAAWLSTLRLMDCVFVESKPRPFRPNTSRVQFELGPGSDLESPEETDSPVLSNSPDMIELRKSESQPELKSSGEGTPLDGSLSDSLGVVRTLSPRRIEPRKSYVGRNPLFGKPMPESTWTVAHELFVDDKGAAGRLSAKTPRKRKSTATPPVLPTSPPTSPRLSRFPRSPSNEELGVLVHSERTDSAADPKRRTDPAPREKEKDKEKEREREGAMSPETGRKLSLDRKSRRLFTAPLLQRVPIFATLSEKRLGVVADVAQRRLYRSGEVIVAEGDKPDAFYVIEEDLGEAAVRTQQDDGVEVELTRLGHNDYFGEKGLLDGSPRSASVCALTDLQAVLIFRKDFEHLVAPYLAASLEQGLNRYQEREKARGLRRVLRKNTSLLNQEPSPSNSTGSPPPTIAGSGLTMVSPPPNRRSHIASPSAQSGTVKNAFDAFGRPAAPLSVGDKAEKERETKVTSRKGSREKVDAAMLNALRSEIEKGKQFGAVCSESLTATAELANRVEKLEEYVSSSVNRIDKLLEAMSLQVATLVKQTPVQ